MESGRRARAGRPGREAACGTVGGSRRTGAGRVGIGVALLLIACRPPPAPSPPAVAVAPQLTSAPAPWVRVRPGLGVVLYEAPAQVLAAPGSIAEVTAPLRAQVVAVHAQPGQRVVAGAPLLTVLMPEVLRAAFAYQGAGLRLAAYGQRREQLMQLKGEGLLRLAELAETDARIAEARAAQLEAQAMLTVAGLSPGEAAALGGRQGRVTLRSPLAGVVTSVGATLGQVSDGGPLVRVVGGSEPRIEARLPPTLPERAEFALCLASGACRPLRLIERAPLVDSRDGKTLAWLVPRSPAGSVGASAAGAGPTAASATGAGASAGTGASAGAVGGMGAGAGAVAAAGGAGAAGADSELVAGLTATLQVSLPARAAPGGEPGPRPVLVPARALLFRDSQPQVIRRRDGGPQPQAVRVLLVAGADALIVAAAEPALKPGDEIAADAGPYATSGEAGEP